jgi:hypothetical protein
MLRRSAPSYEGHRHKMLRARLSDAGSQDVGVRVRLRDTRRAGVIIRRNMPVARTMSRCTPGAECAAESKRIQRPVGLYDGSIDAGLLLLELAPIRAGGLTPGDIAFVCGCTRAYIDQLERSAMRKLRRAFKRRGFERGSQLFET